MSEVEDYAVQDSRSAESRISLCELIFGLGPALDEEAGKRTNSGFRTITRTLCSHQGDVPH